MEEMQQTDHLPEGDPARLFADLVNEVGTLRRLVVANDSSTTLGEMMSRLDAMVEAISQLAKKPAPTLTPDDVAARIAAAGKAARAEDRAAMAQARDRLDMAASLMEGLAGTAATAQQQRRRLAWIAGGGLFAGMLLWSFLSGMLARALPEGWHMPEQRAANIVGEPTMWDAGVRLLRAYDPQAYATLKQAAQMRRENRDAIETCEQTAAQTKKPVRCTVNVGVGSANAGGN